MKVVFLDAGTLPRELSFSNTEIEYFSYLHTTQEDVVHRIKGATVVITNKVKIGVKEMDAAKDLRLIAVAAAGTDNIDKNAASERNIRVENVPDYGSDSVAEHVIASLFALRRQTVEYAAASVDGRWTSAIQFCWTGPKIRDVGETTMGIVGRGRIGQATAALAKGLGMKVIFAQTPGAVAAEDELPFDELLAVADALTLHVPLTEETRGMLGKAAFEKMKSDAVLINTGRGALVDAEALVSALQSGQIGGAAIDVLDVEPPPANHPLLNKSVPNLLVTPHVAWASDRAQARLATKLEQLVAHQLS